MIYLDLFSGIGGFALGAYWAGMRFEKHYFSEIDDYAIKVYRQRFPDAVPLGDITRIDGKALVADTTKSRRRTSGTCRKGLRLSSLPGKSAGQGSGWILSGGFPCQDISLAGKGAGITGKRSGLWFEYARLIGEIRPRYAIMENVGALTRRGLDAVLGSLAEIWYDAEWSDIRASDVGAPHRRERIWIVAYPERIGEWSRLCADEQGAKRRGRFGDCGCPGKIRDSNVPGLEERKGKPGHDATQLTATLRTDWWATEPDMGRVAHGIPARVDRLRCLGNAIVPQIAAMIFQQIMENAT